VLRQAETPSAARGGVGEEYSHDDPKGFQNPSGLSIDPLDSSQSCRRTMAFGADAVERWFTPEQIQDVLKFVGMLQT
jgi:hypothetical protein